MFRSQKQQNFPTIAEGSWRKVVYKPFTARSVVFWWWNNGEDPVFSVSGTFVFGSFEDTSRNISDDFGLPILSSVSWCLLHVLFSRDFSAEMVARCTGQRSNKKPTFMLKCRVHVEKATWFMPLLSLPPVIGQRLVLKKLAIEVSKINHFGGSSNLELLVFLVYHHILEYQQSHSPEYFFIQFIKSPHLTIIIYRIFHFRFPHIPFKTDSASPPKQRTPPPVLQRWPWRISNRRFWPRRIWKILLSCIFHRGGTYPTVTLFFHVFFFLRSKKRVKKKIEAQICFFLGRVDGWRVVERVGFCLRTARAKEAIGWQNGTKKSSVCTDFPWKIIAPVFFWMRNAGCWCFSHF